MSDQSTPPTKTVTVQTEKGPGCLLRGLYFLFIGVWVGFIWMIVAWVLNITIIGLPLGLAMLNNLPRVMTLRPRRVQTTVTTTPDGRSFVSEKKTRQVFFLIRALYFLLIGWWFSLLWLLTAWAIGGFSLGLGTPIAFWMFDRVPAVTTMARN